MSYLMLSDVMSPLDYQTYQFVSYPHNTLFLKKWLDKQLAQDLDFEVFAPLFYVRAERQAKVKIASILVTVPGWYVSNKGKILSKRTAQKAKLVTPKIVNSNQLQVIKFGPREEKRKQTHFGVSRAVASVFVPPPQGLNTQFARVDYHDKNNHNTDHANIYWEPMIGSY